METGIEKKGVEIHAGEHHILEFIARAELPKCVTVFENTLEVAKLCSCGPKSRWKWPKCITAVGCGTSLKVCNCRKVEVAKVCNCRGKSRRMVPKCVAVVENESGSCQSVYLSWQAKVGGAQNWQLCVRP